MRIPTKGTRRTEGSGSGVPTEGGQAFRRMRATDRSEATLGPLGLGVGGRGLWGVGFVLSHGASFELDAVSVVNDAVEDGIGQGGVADGLMPVLEGELTGDERRLSTDTVFQDLQEVTASGFSKGCESEVIDHDEPGLLESIENPGTGAVRSGSGKLFQEPRKPEVAG